MSRKATVVLCDPDERVAVQLDARDRRAFEMARTGLGLPRGPVKEIAAEFPDTYVGYMAWHAMKRARNGTTPDWATFSERLADIEFIGKEDDDPDPTKAAP